MIFIKMLININIKKLNKNAEILDRLNILGALGVLI